MNKICKLRRISLICAMLTAVLIFLFSSQESTESTKVSNSVTSIIAGILIDDFKDMTNEQKNKVINSINMYVRKAAHFTIYTILSIFVSTFMFTYAVSLKNRVIGIIICAFYAATDEFHQFFIPGRACLIADVLIDTSGACLGALIVYLIYIIYKKSRRTNENKTN